MEMLIEEAEYFEAQVTVAFYADGRIEMCIPLPGAKALQERFGVAVDGNMVVDLVLSNKVDRIGEFGVIICEEHDDVM